MASLKASNPHSVAGRDRNSSSIKRDLSQIQGSVSSNWKLCSGDAISDDAKHLISVNFRGKTYILGDVRLVERTSSSPGTILLEFFFDGEMEELSEGSKFDLKSDFLIALGESITRGVQEFYRRRFNFGLHDSAMLAELKSDKFPDTSVLPVDPDLNNTFRDAGCMLRFIAVKVYLSEACAKAVGGVVFPHVFDRDFEENGAKAHIPRWILGMGATTVVMGIATIFAWARIFMYGNELS